MYFKQFYLGCLAHASYLIGSDGQAAVVDPQRDVDQYLAEADTNKFAIKYIIETHLHADFVSGYRELAELTGAEVVFGEQAGALFPHYAAKDGDELRVGKVTLRIIETPGHTPESISVLVIDTEHPKEPRKVLTGDTLFIGDVGRPDLVSAKGFTSSEMASMLYDSLHEKLLTLSDDVEVFPAHGAGSMCGRNISKETSSTIGQQRMGNYALRPMSKDEFVRMMTADLPQAPVYFSKDAEINRAGAVALSEVPDPAPMMPRDFERAMDQGYIVLDVRPADMFGAGHVPGSINIGLAGQFASWAGTLVPFGTPLLIVADDDAKIREAVVRLARVGLESVKGYLVDGMESWRDAGFAESRIPQITVNTLREMLESEEELQVVDVRRAAEYADGHVPSARNCPLGSGLSQSTFSFDKDKKTAVLCAGGYRSSAATSLLAQLGFKSILNVTGGTSAWVAAGYEVER